jgi:hypothetical protein
MTIPETHPDDERLSALAGADPEAATDAALRSHVAGCDRCATLVDELSRLRAALATLPDVAPPRPLRLLPPAVGREPSFAERAAGVVRRVFAPVLATGALVALVGAVGTAGDVGLFGQATSGGAAPGAAGDAAQEEAVGAGAEPGASAPAAGEPHTEALTPASPATPADRDLRVMSADETALPAGDQPVEDESDFSVLSGEQPERSPWPMVLFGGVTLVIAALLLRWILPARPG